MELLEYIVFVFLGSAFVLIIMSAAIHMPPHKGAKQIVKNPKKVVKKARKRVKK